MLPRVELPTKRAAVTARCQRAALFPSSCRPVPTARAIARIVHLPLFDSLCPLGYLGCGVTLATFEPVARGPALEPSNKGLRPCYAVRAAGDAPGAVSCGSWTQLCWGGYTDRAGREVGLLLPMAVMMSGTTLMAVTTDATSC
jgi:hypothetical protein